MVLRLFLVVLCLPIMSVLQCASGSTSSARHHVTGTHAPVTSTPKPLILRVDQGERRIRRFPGLASMTIMKVDGQNGGSSDLVMVYTDIPPGGQITRHWHPIADEIIFVHRGSGEVELGEQKQEFGTGATVYIPKNVRVAVRNTGAETLSAVFVFSKPGFDQYLRETTAIEGEPVIPLSPAELTKIRKRHEWHMVFERP